MQRQSSLGNQVIQRGHKYNTTKICKVTSTKDYHKLGRIEVVSLDYSKPYPVWVVGSIDREPQTGDQVVIGYIEERKDAPYLKGFVKNKAYTTNFIEVRKDRVRVQLPVFQIGVKDGIAHNDVKEHLLNDSKLSQRAYVELAPNHAIVSFPTSEGNPPAQIKITASEVLINHPTGAVVHHKGDREVARKDDEVEVNVPGIGICTGKITSGSSKTKIE